MTSRIHSPQTSPFFSGYNMLITGGVFNHFNAPHPDMINLHKSADGGFHMLSQAISPGAMHDSSERYPPPRCRNGARAETIAQDVIIWVRKLDPSTTKILWLQGPHNTAKTCTAIAQTVSEVCHAEGQLAGSFFFDQHRCGGDDGCYLFSTLAYQIALNVPGMREHVNLAMAHDPTLPTKSIAVQIQSLIIRPFQQLRSTSAIPLKASMVVVIDGLDQCHGQETQRDILLLIADLASSAHQIPLRFLITSQSKPDIRAAFDNDGLASMTRRIVVDAPSYNDDMSNIQSGFTSSDSTFSCLFHSVINFGYLLNACYKQRPCRFHTVRYGKACVAEASAGMVMCPTCISETPAHRVRSTH
ncbi:hypothetical protein BDZ97DRAFT_2000383 [Flammula alnicola]|nr:hypothetical protein BDZ97DRAFT_2000383 [Flammula alnicola]